MTSDCLALVTGTSAGVGAAVADQLLQNGWTVFGVARRARAIAHPGYRHLALDLEDVRSMARIEDTVAPMIRHSAATRIGLVNNAAAPGPLGPIESVEPNDLLRLYAVNVAAPIWLMGLFVRHTPADSALRIVNV